MRRHPLRVSSLIISSKEKNMGNLLSMKRLEAVGKVNVRPPSMGTG